MNSDGQARSAGSTFVRISAADARALMDSRAHNVVDIRDPGAFAAGRISAARLLNNETLQAFIDEADTEQPCLVCCYHGHSSQQVAAFLAAQGFAEVYSIDGGFEQWRRDYPQRCER